MSTNWQTIYNPTPGEHDTVQGSYGVFGNLALLMGGDSQDRIAFHCSKEEALAMAEAFAELAKSIEGAEKIAAQVRAISGQEDAA